MDSLHFPKTKKHTKIILSRPRCDISRSARDNYRHTIFFFFFYGSTVLKRTLASEIIPFHSSLSLNFAFQSRTPRLSISSSTAFHQRCLGLPLGLYYKYFLRVSFCMDCHLPSYKHDLATSICHQSA